MTQTHEVISAFLDDEPFDAAELREALDDPAARDLLVDLVALRQLAQPAALEPTIVFADHARRRARGRWLLAAAALIVATTSGFVVGRRGTTLADPLLATAPVPTRVIDIRSGEWQETPVRGER